MKTKTILVAGWVIVVAAILAGVVNVKRPHATRTVGVDNQAPPVAPPREVARAPKTSLREMESTAAAPAQAAKSNIAVKAAILTGAAQANQPLMINDYVVQDPMARVALSFVGEDPDATEYWMEAINDPSLPAEERKDLIEDLNEDGLSDPRHPSTPEDMQLIIIRIRLLQNFRPMDKVNADAGFEALGDLYGLLNGRPPQ